MQLALAQLSGREGDIAGNLEKALAALEQVPGGTALTVFPETHLSGFAESTPLEARALRLDGPELERLADAARQRDMAIAIGLIERSGERFFNTTVLLTPERGVALHYRKTHLWPDERDFLSPGDRLSCIRWRGLNIGLLICYDIEFPEPARALAALGADLLVVTNGNMDPYGPVHARASAARAQENQCFLVMANRAGRGAGLEFAGESALLDPYGETLFRAGREECVSLHTIDLEALQGARLAYDYRRDSRIRLQGRRSERDGVRSLVIDPTHG